MKLRQDETASTPILALWKIAETDNIDQVEDLLANGVDINVGNVHGTTALMRAASNGRTRMVHSLLSHGSQQIAKRRIYSITPRCIFWPCRGG
jgi:ankyrin repeat protein